MGKANDLITLAKVDLQASRARLAENGGELMENLAAYHTQQAIEKICKALITRSGHQAGLQHNIASLIGDMDEFEIPYPEWVSDEAYEISEWATNVRYNVKIDVDHDAIVRANARTQEWLSQIFQ